MYRAGRAIRFGQTLQFQCTKMQFSSMYKFSVKTTLVEKSSTYADIL